MAASTGTAALARSVSSPIVNSAMTSSPTMKKKNVINPSLMRCFTVMSNRMSPKLNPTGVFSNVQ